VNFVHVSIVNSWFTAVVLLLDVLLLVNNSHAYIVGARLYTG
jgi:hypothetical protein